MSIQRKMVNEDLQKKENSKCKVKFLKLYLNTFSTLMFKTIGLYNPNYNKFA